MGHHIASAYIDRYSRRRRRRSTTLTPSANAISIPNPKPRAPFADARVQSDELAQGEIPSCEHGLTGAGGDGGDGIPFAAGGGGAGVVGCGC